MSNHLRHQFIHRSAINIGVIFAAVATFATILHGFSLASKAGLIKVEAKAASTIESLPEQYFPGNSLPSTTDCTWPPYTPSYTKYCRIILGYTTIFATYDVKQKMITRVSYSGHGETVGDLIMAWGIPTGMKRLPWAMEVHWKNRVVYASLQPFSPKSRAVLIAYTLENEVVPAWKGFLNNK
jgi:hypothetical protein